MAYVRSVDGLVRAVGREEWGVSVGVAMHQVIADGIDDALRDLGAARSIKEDEWLAVIVNLGEGGEKGADGGRIKDGHNKRVWEERVRCEKG